jgi:hypothetical protein
MLLVEISEQLMPHAGSVRLHQHVELHRTGRASALAAAAHQEETKEQTRNDTRDRATNAVCA